MQCVRKLLPLKDGTLTYTVHRCGTSCYGVALAMQVTDETSNMRFNTGISAMMEFINGAYKWDERPRAALEHFVLLLSPYAPHLAEEMWQVINITV